MILREPPPADRSLVTRLGMIIARLESDLKRWEQFDPRYDTVCDKRTSKTLNRLWKKMRRKVTWLYEVSIVDIRKAQTKIDKKPVEKVRKLLRNTVRDLRAYHDAVFKSRVEKELTTFGSTYENMQTYSGSYMRLLLDGLEKGDKKVIDYLREHGIPLDSVGVQKALLQRDQAWKPAYDRLKNDLRILAKYKAEYVRNIRLFMAVQQQF